MGKTMKKLTSAIILISMIMSLAPAAFAATGTSGGQFLKICVDAKAAALGGASATSSGAGSIFLNPAGLVDVETGEAKFSQVSWLEGINYSNISYAHRSGSAILGIGVNYLSVPPITEFDNTGLQLADTYAPHDMAVNISYARKIEKLDLDVGANLKYISSSLADVTGTAYAVDLGAQKKYADENFELGFAVQNLGTKIKFINQEDPLPLNFKLGQHPYQQYRNLKRLHWLRPQLMLE